jgi:hypothetical protein
VGHNAADEVVQRLFELPHEAFHRFGIATAASQPQQLPLDNFPLALVHSPPFVRTSNKTPLDGRRFITSRKKLDANQGTS